MWFGQLRVLTAASEMTSLVCADLSRGSTALHTHPSRNTQAFCSAAQFHRLIPLTPKPLESLQVYSAEMRSKSGQKSPEFLFSPDPRAWHRCRLWELKECHSPTGLAAFGHPARLREGRSPEVPSAPSLLRSRISPSSVTHLALVAAQCLCLQAQWDLEGMIFPARL